MRVIVCGSRDWPDAERIAARLSRLPAGSTIVHGGSGKADLAADSAARRLGHTPEPHRYQDFISERVSGKRAPLERNSHMASLGADLCLAFWDGSSRGTRDMMNKAEAEGIPVERIT